MPVRLFCQLFYAPMCVFIVACVLECLCACLEFFLAVLLFDRLSARQFACICKFMCMFLCVCMFVHLSVRLYTHFCVRLFYILSVCMFVFHLCV